MAAKREDPLCWKTEMPLSSAYWYSTAWVTAFSLPSHVSLRSGQDKLGVIIQIG